MQTKYGTLIRTLKRGTKYYINYNNDIGYIEHSTGKIVYVDRDILEYIVLHNLAIGITITKCVKDTSVAASVSILDNINRCSLGSLVYFAVGIPRNDIGKFLIVYKDGNPLNLIRSNLIIYRHSWRKADHTDFIEYSIIKNKYSVTNDISYINCRVTPNAAELMDTENITFKHSSFGVSLVIDKTAINFSDIIKSFYATTISKLFTDTGISLDELHRKDVFKLDYTPANISLFVKAGKAVITEPSQILNDGDLSKLPFLNSNKQNLLVVRPGTINRYPLPTTSVDTRKYNMKIAYFIFREISIEICTIRNFTLGDIIDDAKKYTQFVELCNGTSIKRFRLMLDKAKI